MRSREQYTVRGHEMECRGGNLQGSELMPHGQLNLQ